MAKIQSKTPILYDACNNRFAKVIIRPRIEPSNDGYNIITTHLIEKSTKTVDETGEEQIRYYEDEILQKKTFVSNQELTGLFSAIKPMIPQGLDYRTERDTELLIGTLVYIKQDFIKDINGNVMQGKTIYNQNPSVWEIVP